jgi:predicted  nucleic acid-binding Zn-ribbon protein
MVERDSLRPNSKPQKKTASDLEDLLVDARRELVKKDDEILKLSMRVSSLQEEASRLEKEVALLQTSAPQHSAHKPAQSLEREVLDLKKLLARVKQERDDLMVEKEKGYIYGPQNKRPASKAPTDFEAVPGEGGINEVYKQNRHTSSAKPGLRGSSFLNESIDFRDPH